MDPTSTQPASVPPLSSSGPSDAATMSQEQMKTNLQDLMSKIDGGYQDFSAHKFSSDNQIKSDKGEALRSIFDLLQSKGIDPNNIEEVKAFLDKLKEQNPDLYQQIESALQELMNEDTQNISPDESLIQDPSQQLDPSSSANMNINNENIQQNF